MRPQVNRFADLMELKLIEHDKKRHWTAFSVKYLKNKMEDCSCQANEAYENCDPVKMNKHLVNMANYAMMISDKLTSQ